VKAQERVLATKPFFFAISEKVSHVKFRASSKEKKKCHFSV
jgi:hypothetical protein